MKNIVSAEPTTTEQEFADEVMSLGFEARMAGLDIIHNPFKASTSPLFLRDAWDTGWAVAEHLKNTERH